MKEELANRHQELAGRWSIRRREYQDGVVHPTIRKWRELSETREPHVVWSELYSIILELDMIALHFCGADIGDTVRLMGKRYQGAFAKIEDIEIRSWHGQQFTPLGEKPRIKVPSPKRHHPVLISGHLWELVGRDF